MTPRLFYFTQYNKKRILYPALTCSVITCLFMLSTGCTDVSTDGEEIPAAAANTVLRDRAIPGGIEIVLEDDSRDSKIELSNPVINSLNQTCEGSETQNGILYVITMVYEGAANSLQNGQINIFTLPSPYQSSFSVSESSIRTSENELQFQICVDYYQAIEVTLRVSVADSDQNESDYISINIISPEGGGTYPNEYTQLQLDDIGITFNTLLGRGSKWRIVTRYEIEITAPEKLASTWTTLPYEVTQKILGLSGTIEGQLNAVYSNQEAEIVRPIRIQGVSSLLEFFDVQPLAQVQGRGSLIQGGGAEPIGLLAPLETGNEEKYGDRVRGYRERPYFRKVRDEAGARSSIIDAKTTIIEIPEVVAGRTEPTASTINNRNLGTIWSAPLGSTPALEYRDLFVPRLFKENQLYRNDGPNYTMDLHYQLPSTSFSTGATSGDIDNDGDMDLVVSNYGQGQVSRLYISDGAFPNTTYPSVITLTQNKTIKDASLVDYDNDSLLDIFIANFQGDDLLFHNDGSGQFSPAPAGTLPTYPPSGCTSYSKKQAGLWADYDDDGDQDLLIINTCLHDPNVLYRNNGNGSFQSVNAGALTNAANAGITRSASWGDYTNDGCLDVAIINEGSPLLPQNIQLFKNLGCTPPNYNYSFQLDKSWVNEGSNVSTWSDFENDGDLDLLVTVPQPVSAGYVKKVPRLYLNNLPSPFTVQSVPVAASGYTSASWADVNKDAFPDYALADYDAQSLVLNSIASVPPRAGNNWIRVRLQGGCALATGCSSKSNADGIGARIILQQTLSNGSTRIQSRELASLTGTGGQNALETIFGLGSHVPQIESIEVKWPSGLVSHLAQPGTNFAQYINNINDWLLIIEP